MAVEGAGDRVDRARRDLVPLADQVRQLAHDRLGHRHLAVGAVECQDIAAQEHVAVEMTLERLHDRVARAGELAGDLVGELELGPSHR